MSGRRREGKLEAGLAVGLIMLLVGQYFKNQLVQFLGVSTILGFIIHFVATGILGVWRDRKRK